MGGHEQLSPDSVSCGWRRWQVADVECATLDRQSLFVCPRAGRLVSPRAHSQLPGQELHARMSACMHACMHARPLPDPHNHCNADSPLRHVFRYAPCDRLFLLCFGCGSIFFVLLFRFCGTAVATP